MDMGPLLNNDLNVQGSDTTGDEHSGAARNQKLKQLLLRISSKRY